MRQDSSSNPERPGSTRYSQEWNWGERSTNSGCYSIQPASGNRGHRSEDSGGLSETPASGYREFAQKIFDEEWWPDEVDLNTVTIGNMSLDSTLVEIDGKRGRYREITVYSGAGESVANPDDWPTDDMKPSKGSVKGQRYVGPGGEKIDNLGELTVKVRTERHGGSDISSRVTFQGAKVRKPLLAVRSD